MTLEHTEIRIDWMEGISIKTFELRSGTGVLLDRANPESTSLDHPVYKAFRVDSPDEIRMGLSDITVEGIMFPRVLQREQINAARISYRNSYEAGAPERTVDVIHLYTWKPTGTRQE